MATSENSGSGWMVLFSIIFAGLSALAALANICILIRQRNRSIAPYFRIDFPVLEFKFIDEINQINNSLQDLPKIRIINQSNNIALNTRITLYYEFTKYYKKTIHKHCPTKYKVYSKSLIGISTESYQEVIEYPVYIEKDRISEQGGSEPECSFTLNSIYINLLHDYTHYMEFKNFDLFLSSELPSLYLEIQYFDTDRNPKKDRYKITAKANKASFGHVGIDNATIRFIQSKLRWIPREVKKFPARIVNHDNFIMA